MNEKKRTAPLTAALTFAMVLIATQNLVKIVLPSDWLADWTLWHIVGVSAILGLVFAAGMWLLQSRSSERKESRKP